MHARAGLRLLDWSQPFFLEYPSTLQGRKEMKTRYAIPVLLVLAPAVSVMMAQGKNAQKTVLTQKSIGVEEIYIARSIRDSRTPVTEACTQAKTGFGDFIYEDQYRFQSTAIRASDGRLVDTNVKTIATGRGCFGKTANPAINNFYLDLLLGGTTLKGIGECHRLKKDFPERGMAVINCVLELSDPSYRYVGGLLTTNTMFSLKPVGEQTDPPGYTQPSIATIRLWKKRAAE
jgi:hypothetical protein